MELKTTHTRPNADRQSSTNGIHLNHTTGASPVTQGQHGHKEAGSDSPNMVTIIVGVLVPLLLIGVSAFIIYIWYRRRYPVRMLGRDFSKFSNPAYNKRASTLTLVRHDSDKDWERLDTLSRRNAELPYINDEDEGIVNTVCEDQPNENDDGNTASQSVEIDIEHNCVYPVKESNSVSLSRERPRTRKAVLVKTETMDDFENGFELSITESDLGHRTESELSSENDSTATHTISLSFSEMFDGRQKEENTTRNDISTDNATCSNGNEHIQTIRADTNTKIENTHIDANIVAADSKEINESENIVGNNDSFDVIADTKKTDVDTTLKSEIQTNTEIQDTLQGIIDLISHATDETDSIQICDPLLDMNELKEPHNIVVESSVNVINDQIHNSKITGHVLNNVPRSESFDLSEIPHSEMIEDNVKGSDSPNSVQQNESFLLFQNSQNDMLDTKVKKSDEQSEKETFDHNVSVDVDIDKVDENYKPEIDHALLELNPEQSFILFQRTENCIVGEAGLTHNNIETPENVNEIRIQFDIDATEKDITELLENDKISGGKVLKNNGSIHIFKPNDSENTLSVESADRTNVPEILDKHDALRKLSPLSLSNEYIVLEAVPPTPTVLVQESIIFEPEAKLPIHLDSTYISPVRGRRAFTLNDIVFKRNTETGRRNSDLNLPSEGFEEKSKSSPEISTVKSNDDKSTLRTYFDFANLNWKQGYISENSTSDNQDQSEYTDAENNKESASSTIEGELNSVSGYVPVSHNNKSPISEVFNTEQSENINWPTHELVLDDNNLKNSSKVRESLDCGELLGKHKDAHVTISASIERDIIGNSSCFNEGTGGNVVEQSHENKADPFNLCSTVIMTEGNINNIAEQPRHKEHENNTLERVTLDEGNPFLNSFLQLSTTTSHAVVDSISDIKEDFNQVIQSSTRTASAFGYSTTDLKEKSSPFLQSSEDSTTGTKDYINPFLQSSTLTPYAVEDSTTDPKEDVSLIVQSMAPTAQVIDDSNTDSKEEFSPFNYPSKLISPTFEDSAADAKEEFDPFSQQPSTPTSSVVEDSITNPKENFNLFLKSPEPSAVEETTTDFNEEPFLNLLTPTLSFVEDSNTDAQISNKKTLIPSAFHFGNMNDIDNDFGNSDSAETSGVELVHDRSIEIQNSNAISIFESDVLGISEQTIEARGAGGVHPFSDSIFMTDDSVNITTSTGSPVALSWDILSGKNSQESRNAEHYDIENQAENEIGRLRVSLSGKSNNEENLLLDSQTILVLTTETSKPLTSNNTSMCNAETTDTSWDIINGSGDNSKC